MKRCAKASAAATDRPALAASVYAPRTVLRAEAEKKVSFFFFFFLSLVFFLDVIRCILLDCIAMTYVCTREAVHAVVELVLL